MGFKVLLSSRCLPPSFGIPRALLGYQESQFQNPGKTMPNCETLHINRINCCRLSPSTVSQRIAGPHGALITAKAQASIEESLRIHGNRGRLWHHSLPLNTWQAKQLPQLVNVMITLVIHKLQLVSHPQKKISHRWLEHISTHVVSKLATCLKLPKDICSQRSIQSLVLVAL